MQRRGYVVCLCVCLEAVGDFFLVLVQCVQNCCQKFMRGSARVGQRFGELSAEAESQMQQLMQQQQGGSR
jgi:hypothetical protein